MLSANRTRPINTLIRVKSAALESVAGLVQDFAGNALGVLRGETWRENE
jgi:hypothetical protein